MTFGYGLGPDVVGMDESGMVPGLPAGAMVRRDASVVARGQFLSGARVVVAPGQQAVLTFTSQAPFRANSIVLQTLGLAGGNVSSAVVVRNVKVATQEQMIGQTNEVPLTAFSQDNLLGKLQLDTVQVGQVMTITLEHTNPVGAAETIAGVAYGIRLQNG